MLNILKLNIQGPLSRQLMQRLLSSTPSEDLSNDGFPFRCIREISIGYARVLCARITYVGELGYELFIPAEHGTLIHLCVIGKLRYWCSRYSYFSLLYYVIQYIDLVHTNKYFSCYLRYFSIALSFQRCMSTSAF